MENKSRKGTIGMLFICKLMILVIVIMGCEGEFTIQDENPYYDTDGDGISNCVEENNANSHHNFNKDSVDQNPSIAHGYPWNGYLEGGINLCDEEEGYKHFLVADSIDSDDWGTLALINLIEGGGRNWEYDCPPRICILDMSKQAGGNWPPHSSHQNGLDVDIRYVRKDNLEIPLNIKEDSNEYDNSATADMMNALYNSGNIEVIFIDTVYANITDDTFDILQHSPGHLDHFHVRIEDPDGI